MRVIIPSALHSYTGGKRQAEAVGKTVAELIKDLDRQFPGFGFRIVDEQGALRPHIRVSVNLEVVASLDSVVKPTDEVALIQAFSGG
ncbi:MAG: MoaD/ThiS family protein [Elusimicrobia bacterium]|nr:MoaD/ThiS family protein [Elusimicrobiota bacterium]